MAIPKINNRYVCIVDKDRQDLAAVVSSYFSSAEYLPVFLFPEMGAPAEDGDNFQDDGFISRMIGAELSVLINNALAKGNRCDYIIYAGLSEQQKSYLSFPRRIVVIDIEDVGQVEVKLSKVFSKRRGEVVCRQDQLLEGLYAAKRENKKLTIRDDASDIALNIHGTQGVIVVENDYEASSVIAVNYAHSVNADLIVVQELGKREGRRMPTVIQKWKEGDESQYAFIESKVVERVGSTKFEDYSFATFFTEGLPYSLVLRNLIPCTYVNLKLRPDFFVYNTILYETIPNFHSAVLFSPEFFEDEETEKVEGIFTKQNYYLRTLYGKDAVVWKLDFHAQHFPYDVLHICSHGGEVEGATIEESFTDRKGDTHVVVYQLVAGFEVKPGRELIGVSEKKFFRTFDGYEWMSDELDARKYPRYVFEDMRKALFYRDDLTGKEGKVLSRGLVPSSCYIACSDSIHQGSFRVLASHNSPIVFNNSCWSWGEVAQFFLAGGARGYVGTLWAINNSAAVIGAETFYENLFGNTALDSFYKALTALAGTEDENIYIYWGLHFSTVAAATTLQDSRRRVFRELIRAVGLWVNRIRTTKSEEVRKNCMEVVRLIREELSKNFSSEDLKHLKPTIRERIKNALGGNTRG